MAHVFPENQKRVFADTVSVLTLRDLLSMEADSFRTLFQAVAMSQIRPAQEVREMLGDELFNVLNVIGDALVKGCVKQQSEVLKCKIPDGVSAFLEEHGIERDESFLKASGTAVFSTLVLTICRVHSVLGASATLDIFSPILAQLCPEWDSPIKESPVDPYPPSVN
jgi:hypothetical protein